MGQLPLILSAHHSLNKSAQAADAVSAAADIMLSPLRSAQGSGEAARSG